MIYMTRALELAQVAAGRNEVPVGAVLVKDGVIMAESYNFTETTHDPTAHAELLAIRAACGILESPRLPECDLYVTLEPCAMCAAAISFARIRRLYFGAYDAKGGAVEHGPRFFAQTTCHHRPEIIGGVEEKAAAELLKTFFIKKR